MADGRCRGVAVRRIHQHRNIIGGQHLQRRNPGRLGQAVGVAAEEQRAVGALGGAVLGDGLGGGQDVGLVEGAVETGAAVPGGPEAHLLGTSSGSGDTV